MERKCLAAFLISLSFLLLLSCRAPFTSTQDQENEKNVPKNERETDGATKGKPVVIEFYADW